MAAKIKVNHANLPTSLMSEVKEAQEKASGKDSNAIVPDDVVLRGTSMPNNRKVTWYLIKVFIRDLDKRKTQNAHQDLKRYLGEDEAESSSQSKKKKKPRTAPPVQEPRPAPFAPVIEEAGSDEDVTHQPQTQIQSQNSMVAFLQKFKAEQQEYRQKVEEENNTFRRNAQNMLQESADMVHRVAMNDQDTRNALLLDPTFLQLAINELKTNEEFRREFLEDDDARTAMAAELKDDSDFRDKLIANSDFQDKLIADSDFQDKVFEEFKDNDQFRADVLEKIDSGFQARLEDAAQGQQGDNDESDNQDESDNEDESGSQDESDKEAKEADEIEAEEAEKKKFIKGKPVEEVISEDETDENFRPDGRC